MSDAETDTTILRKRGIRKRMQCSGQAAKRIEDTFVTVEQLVDAVLSETELTGYDGIGPKTAEVIEDWWENRFEREERMGSSSVERTSSKSATIHFHTSWSSAIERSGGDR
jgi:ERCC4-type nuclease